MSDPSLPRRLLAGIGAPAIGTWAIDPEYAYVGFVGRHLTVTPVRGRFTSVSGRIHIAEDPAESSVEATIAMASVSSGSAARDDRLHSAEHLDVARHPTAVFRSTEVLWDGPYGRVIGELTVVGITNIVELDVYHRGCVIDRRGDQRSTFSASALVNREDWGLTWNVTLDGGGVLAGRLVRLEIDVETVRRPSESGQ